MLPGECRLVADFRLPFVLGFGGNHLLVQGGRVEISAATAVSVDESPSGNHRDVSCFGSNLGVKLVGFAPYLDEDILHGVFRVLVSWA